MKMEKAQQSLDFSWIKMVLFNAMYGMIKLIGGMPHMKQGKISVTIMGSVGLTVFVKLMACLVYVSV